MAKFASGWWRWFGFDRFDLSTALALPTEQSTLLASTPHNTRIHHVPWSGAHDAAHTRIGRATPRCQSSGATRAAFLGAESPASGRATARDSDPVTLSVCQSLNNGCDPTEDTTQRAKISYPKTTKQLLHTMRQVSRGEPGELRICPATAEHVSGSSEGTRAATLQE